MAILNCPACKSKKNYELHRWDKMPLGVLSLPRSEKEALQMPQYPIDLRRCAACGHVYHTEFEEQNLAYEDDSTLVFNQGAAWMQHQADLAQDWIQRFNLSGAQVVEIGCGEGKFLEHFKKMGCECVGFEPGRDAATAAERGIKVFQEKFQGACLTKLHPKALLCRHVIEHLVEPVDFLQDIALNCAGLGLSPLFLAEVPRIDKALAQHRISDFFYEHISHFTEASFRTLFEVSGYEVLGLESRYGEEVVTIAAKPREQLRAASLKTSSQTFRDSVERQVRESQRVCAEWQEKNKKIALWGSAGKAAALINMFGFTRDKFPIVVDSDSKKVGHFVPGTGQEIRSPSYLKTHPVDGILVCTNWRARDIEKEIRNEHKLKIPLYVQLDEKIVELTSELKL
jgi:Methyltransferase domain/C-methyltransferase C-terminal domain